MVAQFKSEGFASGQGGVLVSCRVPGGFAIDHAGPFSMERATQYAYDFIRGKKGRYAEITDKRGNVLQTVR